MTSDQSEQPVLYPGHEDADPERPLYPEVTVHLSTGHDGNIGAIMATVRDALTRAGTEDAAGIMSDMWGEVFNAKSCTESLAIVMRYVTVT